MMSRRTIGSYSYATGEAFDANGAPLGTFTTHADALAAMHKAQLPWSFYRDVKIAPIPLFADLADFAIKHNERRMPKWKFRLATDLAVQIQPRVSRASDLLFEGTALHCADVTASMLAEGKTLEFRRYWRMRFTLSAARRASDWTLKPASVARAYGCGVEGLLSLRSRLISALVPERFERLDADLMLSPFCLCCGRTLTDPASMGRWVGPECYGSASINLPQLFRAQAA